MSVNCYILDRASLAIKASFLVAEWEVNVDYLTNEKSSFLPVQAYQAKQGDFLIAKHGDFDKVIGTSFVPFYFGVVDSFDNQKVITCDLMNLLNFEFAATRVTGNDIAGHIQQLITRYLLNDTGKHVGSLSVSTDNSTIPYSYQPSDPPTPTILTEYLIDCFQKYNVLWSVDSLMYEADNTLSINTSVKVVASNISLKNNAVAFQNWDVYVDPAGTADSNKLVIVDKSTSDMMNPIILSTWYIKADGDITQTLGDGVYTPTRDKMYVYDIEEDDPPSYQEVAQSELSASKYAHEISFDLMKNNHLLNFSDLQVGILATIVFNSVVYPSVLTGYLINSSSDLITLRFGHIRSTMQQVLQNIKR